MSKYLTFRNAAAITLLCGMAVQSASALTPASGQTVPTFAPVSPYGGEITVTGATLFGDFFRFPAQTNDYIDANGDGCSGPTACVQNLATPFAPGAAISTFWAVTYRGVGSVNGLKEFVDWEIAPVANTVFPMTAPSAPSFFNGFQFIDANGNINWPNVGCLAGTGQPFCPEFIDIAVSDVPIDYGVIFGIPADARWDRKPEQSGYGQNPRLSNTGYPSLLQTLSRAGALVSLNTNTAAPDAQTIYNTKVAYVPIAILTNRGTGLQDVRMTQLQHLFVTGRLPSGENLAAATRSVGSGTRNASMNSLNIDPSFARGDNLGNEFTTSLNSHLGPNFLSTNAEGSSRMEEVMEYDRLAVGYTGLGGASRAANDRAAGRYELLNVCKDIDGDGNGLPDSDCTPSAGPIPHGAGNDVSAPNNGFVRPSITTAIDNSDPRTGWQISGVEVFITRGDPLGMSFDFNGDTVIDLGPDAGHAGNPAMTRGAPAAYIRNITESNKAFTSAPGNVANIGMPGEYLGASFFLLTAVDALSRAKPTFATEDPTKYLDQVGTGAFSQTAQDYIRGNNDLALANAVGPFGAVNSAGLAPFRKKSTDSGGIPYVYPDTTAGKFSDGSTDGKYFYCDALNIIRSIGNPTALSARNAIAGDFNSDGFRDVADIPAMVQAYYAPRTFDCGTFHAGATGGMTANVLIPEVVGDFNGDGQLDKEDLRYFMDGLGMYPNHGGALDRKQAAIAIDNAILASAPTGDYVGNPVTTHDMLPWGDTGRDIVPGAPVVGAAVNPITHNPKFKKPSPGVDDLVTPFLKTHKPYQPGDFRGDVAGSTRPNTPTPGAGPTGYDGVVDARDIDYVCKNFGMWSNLNQAVGIDLSCDMTGDLVVDSHDVDELVLVILGTHYGDTNLDGVIDAADEPQGPFPHPGGWADGSFDCDGMVTQADHDIWEANLQSCGGVPGDFNHDCRVNATDLTVLHACRTGTGVSYNPLSLPPGCNLTPNGGHIAADFDQDGDVGQSDFGKFQRCYSGAQAQTNPNCAN